MKKRIGMGMLTAVLALSVTACGSGGDESSGGKEGDAPKAITIATGGTGGVYYPMGGSLAQVFKDDLKITATAQSTGASLENMQLLSKNDVQVAFTQNDIADYAVNGTEVFKEKLDNISGIAALYPEIIQIVVAADSDIKTVADLKGKKVSVGAPGSGNEANSKQILDAAGLSYDDIDEQLKSYSDSADSFKDGMIDAMFVTSGVPNTSVSDIAIAKKVRVINMDAEVISNLKNKYPFYVDAKVPSGSYEGQDADATTLAVLASLTVRSDLSEDFVYKLTKSLYENLDNLKTKHDKFNEIKVENALTGLTIPIHPGAQKYFDEKGVKKQ